MRLNELLEWDSSTAQSSISVAARRLTGVLRVCLSSVEEALEWRDPGQTMPAMRPAYQWLNDNFKSNKQYSISSTLKKLGSQRERSIVQNMFRNITLNGKMGTEELLFVVTDTLTQLLQMWGDKNVSGLAAVARDLQGKLKQLRAIRMSDRGIDRNQQADDEDRQKRNEEKRNLGAQTNQAEQLVASVLSQLPKDVAAEIRRNVMRSDNKIAALQQELSKRNIQL